MSHHLRHHTTGNSRPWRWDQKPLDASLRYQMHGPVRPMEEPSLLRRLLSFGRG